MVAPPCPMHYSPSLTYALAKRSHLTRSDNDAYSHLNNTVYSHLYDSIINSYLITHCGLKLPSAAVPSSQIGLVVSSYSSYFAPISFPAVVELGLRVNKLGKSSVEYEVGVFEEGQEEVRAVGGFTHVFVGRENRRPEAEGMTRDIRDGLERLEVGRGLWVRRARVGKL